MLVFKVANVDDKCYSEAFFVGKKEMKVRHPSGLPAAGRVGRIGLRGTRCSRVSPMVNERLDPIRGHHFGN